ncbi:metallophosphoesterase family protein [Thermogutta sp.]|jgi:Icc-related predicted phosphoesterase|uniref:metallophosphoesterase family protein n=1 Tax=Thermogutta sp. TaxID=1962930 RepID=UPI0032204EA4
MVILAISDLHGNRRALDRILDRSGPCDVILLGGDLTHFGSGRDVEPLIERCREKTPIVYAVAGNCDTKEVVQRLDELGVNLAARGTVINGVGVHGLPGIPVWRPGMYQFTEDELQNMLEQGWIQLNSASCRITLAHVPPRNCAVDRVYWGCHVGSVALRQFIQRNQPAVVVCGHVHEGRGIATEGSTQIVNCGHGSSGFYAKISLDVPPHSPSIQITLHEA